MLGELTVACRVLLSGLPPDGFDGFEGYAKIVPALQRGKEEIEPGAERDDGLVAFSCALRAKRDARTGRPNFLGEHAFGTPQERFLYICWLGERDGERRSFRRIKVHLKTVDWSDVERAAGDGKALEAEVSALAKDGGPACASVPLLGGGWRLAEA